MAYFKAGLKFLFSIIICLILSSGTGPAQTAPEVSGTAETGFYYTIQKGDTLWDLSQKFYNSQWDWPGLWEMNKEIKNPHWIYPGKKIRVFLKEEAAPAPEPQITEPAPQPPPDPITPTFAYPAISKVGFIRKTQAESLGSIIRERDGNVMMSVGDVIYIRPTGPGTLTPGERYHIFNVETVKEKINKQRFEGLKHLIKAEIEVTENTKEYAVALIKVGYRDVAVGDMIMSPLPRQAEIEIQENPAPIDAVIVCSEDNTVLVNDYRIAFINKGTGDQIRPGQIYSILQSQDKRSFFDGKDAVLLSPLYSGKLIVLHTEDISSTVVILSSKRDIHPGDMVN